ncbi:MAG: hypothetical protein FWC23_08990 [Chitinispirillia bacterium]|nr:hypothetical protein [Chitinispirillia bacterium]MCL2269303.1 hypothetical protein [Chitinispirillia bacterium]
MEDILQILLVVAVLLAVILQLITISMLAAIRGKGRGPHGHRRPDGAGGDGRPERKEGGQRGAPGNNNRKPGEGRGDRPQQPRQGGPRPPQQGQQQSQPGGAIDPMEKSLRDINLRLKNAEREQESARKKIQDGGVGNGTRDDRGPRDGSRDVRPPRPSGPGGNRGDRNDRNGGRRDFNRDQRRDGRPDIRPDRPPRDDNGGMHRPEFIPGQQREDVHQRPPFQHSEQPASSPDAPAGNDIGGSEEMQHGRRFTAKRRQLPENGGDGAPESDAPPQAHTAPVDNIPDAPVHTEQPQQDEGADIQFGRGRR